MSNIPTMLAAAHDIKERLDELLLRGRVQDSGEHRVAATLCLTIAEPFSATLNLIGGGFSPHAPVIVRSMLEGHANLLNLVSDPAYGDQIRYDNARSDVVLFTEYAADPKIQDNADTQETLARWKADAEPARDGLEAKAWKTRRIPAIQESKYPAYICGLPSFLLVRTQPTHNIAGPSCRPLRISLPRRSARSANCQPAKCSRQYLVPNGRNCITLYQSDRRRVAESSRRGRRNMECGKYLALVRAVV